MGERWEVETGYFGEEESSTILLDMVVVTYQIAIEAT